MEIMFKICIFFLCNVVLYKLLINFNKSYYIIYILLVGFFGVIVILWVIVMYLIMEIFCW